jgi:aminobenzoyl-glutamate utilization protein B
MHEARTTALNAVEQRTGYLSDANQAIWHFAEPAWREYRSAAWYVDQLRNAGFDVEPQTGGMPTAFRASYGSGDPVVATYVEYDAVPGNSQAAVPYESPRLGTTRHAAGHTDPHSALGVGAFGGALATQQAIRRHRLAGTLVVFGEPAEKMQGAKPVHAAKGYYDELAAAVSFHPAYMPPFTNTTRWDTHCGAWGSRVYTFQPHQPERWEHAAGDASAIPGAHAATRAPGAIDAVCLMYTISKQLREHVLPHTGSWSVNEAILAAGQATADNLAPDISQIQYSWRVPTITMADQVAKALDGNADHVAALTGCVVTGQWVSRSRPGLPNHVMARAAYANLDSVGPPVFGAAADAFGHAIRASLGRPETPNPLAREMSELVSPQAAEQQLRERLPAWQKHFTSDDYVEYTWHCPTARLIVGRCTMASDPQDGPYPAWVTNAIGGYRDCIDPTIMTAARAVALTLVDLLTDPALLAAARAEFVDRTGGGIGGDAWVAPLLAPDFQPPIDLRWPEYVTTVRGAEWWIT